MAVAPSVACGKDSQIAPGMVRFNMEIAQRVSDVLLPGMNQPAPHGALGGTVELQVGVARGWLLSASGNGLGSWFDYNNGLDANGKSTEFEPGFRLGIDRSVLEMEGGAQALVGAGFEYVEVRSWVHNLVFTTPFDLTGPRNFIRGISFRGSLVGPSWARMRPFARASGLLYLAEAEDPSIHSRYHWMGRSTSLALGLSVELVGP